MRTHIRCIPGLYNASVGKLHGNCSPVIAPDAVKDVELTKLLHSANQSNHRISLL